MSQPNLFDHDEDGHPIPKAARPQEQSPLFRQESPEKQRARLGGHGILTDADLADLKAGTQRVWALMKDNEWHSAESIRMAAGDGTREATEGLRRMRELRELIGPSIRIEKRCEPGRHFFYRIVKVQA